MIIKNYNDLVTDATREDALEIINAGMEAVLTENAMERFVTLDGSTLTIRGNDFDLDAYDNVYLIGGGKAAADMATYMNDLLGDRITEGLVTDVVDRDLENVEVVKGNHPLPSQTNMEACSRMVDIAERATADDLVLALISGGGSAILAYPRVKLQTLIDTNQALLKSGASIDEINAVRKHISNIKGGQLSQIANPATVVTAIFSDVLGNDLSVIASGPTVNDPSTMQDGQDVLDTYGIDTVSIDDMEETPNDDAVFDTTTNILLLENSVAVDAMVDEAIARGYDVERLGLEVEGEARDLGKELAEGLEAGTAFIGAGETTVTVTSDGKGGRNQEVALGAIGNFAMRGAVVSAGTDGIDNTEAAGAIADKHVEDRASIMGLDPDDYLSNNDAFHFFEKTQGLIMTGPTGTNVADIMLGLGAKDS
jgi:glycerate-2-kinase